jgi:hypothetical protein
VLSRPAEALGAIRYRAGQFFAALGARRHPPDEAPAARILPPDMLALFGRMPVEDRRHGLEVLARLEAGGAQDPVLLQAALLHDVGKAEAGVGLVHRVARVALRGLCPPLWRWLSQTPTGWRRPFWAVANHPARGAAWVASLGADPALERLIRHHEAALPEDGSDDADIDRQRALAAVDAQC